MTNLPDKGITETILLTFDFSPALAEMGLSDQTLAADPVVSTSTIIGSDTGLVVGTASVQGLLVKMLVSSGVAGSAYEIACTGSFSDGESRRLSGLLRVVS